MGNSNKKFPQLAKYLRTEKISIEDNTQTAFKNYNPELTFDQCEQLYWLIKINCVLNKIEKINYFFNI